jgi:hypothetical protein
MNCPICGLLNPNETVNCDCGFNFKNPQAVAAAICSMDLDPLLKWAFFLCPIILMGISPLVLIVGILLGKYFYKKYYNQYSRQAAQAKFEFKVGLMVALGLVALSWMILIACAFLQTA